jgi:sigma-E factor negative regulatory protein RseC
MNDSGIITSISDGLAHIQMNVTDACEHCGAKVICKPSKEGNHTIVAENSLNAKIGDSVTVEETDNILLKLSMIQYGIPLIGFLLGLFIPYGLGLQTEIIPTEILLFISGIAGLTISTIPSRLMANNIANNQKFCFRIIEIN